MTTLVDMFDQGYSIKQVSLEAICRRWNRQTEIYGGSVSDRRSGGRNKVVWDPGRRKVKCAVSLHLAGNAHLLHLIDADWSSQSRRYLSALRCRYLPDEHDSSRPQRSSVIKRAPNRLLTQLVTPGRVPTTYRKRLQA